MASRVPPLLPLVGNAAANLQPGAVATQRGVYFSDKLGVIRLLEPSGTVSEVTRVPLDDPSRQELSFAVNPAADELVASRITFPPRSPGSTDQFAPGPVVVDVFHWMRGGPATPTRQESIAQGDIKNLYDNRLLVMVGWNASGPIGMVNTTYGAQYGITSRWYGTAGHVGPTTGAFEAPLCAEGYAVSGLADGTVACLVGKQLKVRGSSGALAWYAGWSPNGGHPADNFVSLSPDARRVCGTPAASGAVSQLLGQDGTTVSLDKSFHCRGWITPTVLAGTLHGYEDGGELGIVDLAKPSEVRDLGRVGTFLGVLSQAG